MTVKLILVVLVLAVVSSSLAQQTSRSRSHGNVSWNGNCVRDSSNPRLLPFLPGNEKQFPSLTPAKCIKACNDQNYNFAGVQYGNECWCGDDAPPEDKIVDTEECNQSCEGDSAKKCGGFWRMNVYRIGNPCQLDDTYLKGIPIEGGEVEDIPSWSECNKLCVNHPECESFTWNYWPYVCYLMSNVPDEAHTGKSEGAISGIKSDLLNCGRTHRKSPN